MTNKDKALEIIDKLKLNGYVNNRERGVLRRALLEERPTEVNCSHCDYFKFSQSFIENVVKFMTDYNIESVEDLMKELNRINELLGGGAK